MNKIYDINLGGYPFTIDQDAYTKLDNYLKTIRSHFESSEGFEEITSDIESRIAELMNNRSEGKKIISIKDIEESIKIMGTPEDFGAEIPEAPIGSDEQKKKAKGKRLYRIVDDQLLSGVCSGLAVYFNMADPLWMRILFIVLTFITGGIGIIAYLILWAIIPEAKSSSDILSARGEKINVSNIAKVVEEEFVNISDTITDIGNEISGKKKSGSAKRNSGSLLAKGVSGIGRLFAAIINLIKKIIKPIIFVFCAILVISLILSWLSMIISYVYSLPMIMSLKLASPFSSFIGLTNVLFVLAIPLIALFFMCARLLFKFRLNKYWHTGMWSFWGLNILSFIVISLFVVRNFNYGTESFNKMEFIAGDTIYVDKIKEHYDDIIFGMGDLRLSDDQIVTDEVDIDIVRAKDNKYSVETEVRSRGRSSTAASENAERVFHAVDISGNKVEMSNFLVLDKGAKWRAQYARVNLNVPEGKYVMIERSARRWYRSYRRGWLSSGLYLMTNDGLVSVDSEKER